MTASLSVDLALSNNEKTTATVFRGLRRLWLGPSGRDVLCQPAQGGRHPDPVTRMTRSSQVCLENTPVPENSFVVPVRCVENTPVPDCSRDMTLSS